MAGGRPATLSIQITADASQAGRTLQRTQKDVAELGQGAKAGFAAVAAGAAVAGAAVLAFAGKAVQMASEAQQAVGGVEAVFKQNANVVKQWAKDASQAVGLSAEQYNRMATLIGSQLKNMGVSIDQLGPKTDSLIKLGADLAAMFGGTTLDAVDALSSALKGEADPIERYGISLNEAAIQAEAALLGISALTLETDRNARLTAIMSLVTKQSADASGAFARESDTLAGAQQRLKADLDNTIAALGERLLPALTAVTSWINSSVLPAIKSMAGDLGEQVSPQIAETAAAVSEVFMPALRELWAFIRDVLAPVLRKEAGDAFRSLAGSVKIVVDSLRENHDVVELLVGFIKGFLIHALVILVTHLEAVALAWRVIATAIDVVINSVQDLIDDLQDLWHWWQKFSDNPFKGLGDLVNIPNLIGFSAGGSGASGAASSRALTSSTGTAGNGGSVGTLAVTPVVHVYLDGQEVRGLVASTVARALRADGARIVAGGWA